MSISNKKFRYNYTQIGRKGKEGITRKFNPFYGIFKIKNEKLFGYVECSFSMDWDPNRVYVYTDTVTPERIKDVRKYSPKAFILRVSRRKIYIPELNKWLKVWFDYDTLPQRGKYEMRNWRFVLCT